MKKNFSNLSLLDSAACNVTKNGKKWQSYDCCNISDNLQVVLRSHNFKQDSKTTAALQNHPQKLQPSSEPCRPFRNQ
jgi:hypothetical protein